MNLSPFRTYVYTWRNCCTNTPSMENCFCVENKPICLSAGREKSHFHTTVLSWLLATLSARMRSLTFHYRWRAAQATQLLFHSHNISSSMSASILHLRHVQQRKSGFERPGSDKCEAQRCRYHPHLLSFLRGCSIAQAAK